MNNEITLLTVVGARPQFIKAATISRAILDFNKQSQETNIQEILVHTGQHYDSNMSKVFFDQLKIRKPDYNLEVGSGSHGEQTGKILERVEAVLVKEKPNICLVYGDTNSTLAGALAAVKLHIPVAHIEAGLRSYNRIMPEETNRVLTDHVSALLFCPTKISVENLAKEGITKGIHLIGDVMYDIMFYYLHLVKDIEHKTLEDFSLKSKSFYLATIHRAENTNEKKRLFQIVEAFNQISEKEAPVVLPLHPRTIKHVEEYGLKFGNNVKVIEPVSYLNMIILEKNAKVILTDSGGVQKEAYFLEVPCVTLRDETEWVETVENKVNFIAGADSQNIKSCFEQALKSNTKTKTDIYGDGTAAKKAVEIIFENLH